MQKGVSNEHDTRMAFPDLLQEKVAFLRSCLAHWDRHFVASVLLLCEWNQKQWVVQPPETSLSFVYLVQEQRKTTN